MKRKIYISAVLLFTLVLSCRKHEVVPAPVESLELETNFTGLINGTDVEYSEDVDGYNGSSEFDQYITSIGADTMVYYAKMSSDLKTPYIRIGVGSIEWDASTLATPSITQFEDFFLGLNPDDNGVPVLLNYSLKAKNGFEVTYYDNAGLTWVSTLEHDGNVLQNPPTPIENPTFSNVTIEKDTDGSHYTFFTVNFGCELYRFKAYINNDPLLPDYDTIRIENGVFKGWIKR
ncbi:MAG: hypothetical protein HYU67_10385 [Flavobacteriia bacterium]|nr:hypothetical protein [Flavobacteriia bacterium]